MWPIFKTQLLIFKSKATNLNEKIFFGKITHHLGQEIRKMQVKEHDWEREFHIPFWAMIYMLLKLKFYF